MMQAIIKPKILPVNIKPKDCVINKESTKVSSCIIPTAKIRPGKAYPNESDELKNDKNEFFRNLIEQLIIKANIEHKRAATNARIIEFIEVFINLLLKKSKL